jgi:hypothetical protein
MNAVINFFAIFTRYLFDFLLLFIFLRVILSWFPIPPGKFTKFLRNITDPVFRYMYYLPFARVGLLDLTPLWAYFFIRIAAWGFQILFLRMGANPGIYAL